MQKTKRRFNRLLSLILSVAMCLSALPTTVLAEEDGTTSTWTKVGFDEISPEDQIAVTMTASDGTTYALPNADASKGPSAAVVTVSGDTLTIEDSKDSYAWTFTEADGGGCHITSPSGSYLYTTAANNGIRVGSTEMTWTLDGDYLSAVDSKGATRWLGVYTVNPDWRAYTNTTGNTAGQSVGFWKLSSTSEGGGSEITTVDIPSASYSETEGTITFNCTTSGVTYYYSADASEYTALEGNVLNVSGYANGTVISYYAELDGVQSDVASITVTITESGGEGEEKTIITIAEAKAASVNTENLTVEGTVVHMNGKNVYVQDETGGIDLYFSTAPADISVGDVVRATGTRASYKGLEELSGVTEYEKIGNNETLPSNTVTITDILADQEAGTLESTRVYIENAVIGAVNTSGNTTLTQGDSSINIYRIPALEGISEGDTVSLYAVISDFSGYQLLVASAADVKLISQGGEEEPDGLASGSYVIWAPAYNMALSSTYNGYYNAGIPVSETEGALAGYAGTEVWDVTANADGTYTIAYGDKNLAMASSFSSLTLGEVNDQWVLEDAGDDLYYVKNTGRNCYIEWYASKSNWSGYGTIAEGSEGMFALKFTPVTTEEDPDALTGTLVNELIQGDQVVIYYPQEKLVMTGTASGSKLAGVAASVEDSSLSTTKEAVVLTVRTTDDGYYTFENEGKYLTSGATGSSLTLGDKSDYSLWELESAGDGSFYIKNVNAKYGSNSQYVEYYSGFTTYSFSSSKPDIYSYQFYKTGAIEVAVEYDTDLSLVYNIAQWGGGGPYDDNHNSVIHGDKYAVGDMKDSKAAFTVVANGAAAQPYQKTSTSTGGNNYYMGGANIGAAEGDYMQFNLSTAGWGDMSLSFRLRATNAAPGSFQLQYSADGGETFTNFTAGEYSYAYTKYTSDGTSDVTGSGAITDGVAKTSLAPTYYVNFSFDVPAGAENVDNLLIRLVAGSEKANGSAGTPGGNIRIDSVILSGSPIVDESITGYVKVSPDGIEEDQPVGTELTMNSSTDGATILYRFVDPEGDGSEDWKTYHADSKPVLSELPAVLEVRASSDGRADSVSRLLSYSSGTVQAVKMSPNGGGVYVSDESVEVTLTTATEGATIYYSTASDSDGNDIYVEYDPENEPIMLKRGFETLTIKAYAVRDGFKDSAVVTRIFTERDKEAYDIYFGQMHSHTSYSDGAGTADDAYKHASGVKNLDFLAVTDHSNSFDGAADSEIASDASTISEEWKEGKALAKQYTTDDFVGLFGYEMTWSNGLGHINTFNTPGFQSRTQSAYSTYSTALQNYYASLKTVGDSISQFNHPGTTFGDFSDFAYYDEEIDQLITLIEVGNGEGAIGSSGYFPSYEYYTRALDKGWHVAPTNNQDNHKGLWGDSNTARSVVLVDSLTEDDIYDAMRNYRVYATEDNDLSIYYTLEGYTMGTILSEGDVDDTVTLSVKLSDPTDSSIGKVEVIVNGGYSLASTNVSGNEDTVTFTVGADYSYYYIKVTEADGDIAVTAPVWVGEVEAVGISTFTTDAALAVQDQELNLTLDLYNNEKKDFEIDNIEFTIDGETIHTADLTNMSKVSAMDTASYTFAYTYDGLGATNIYATVTGTLNGVTKVYQDVLQLNYVSSEMVTRVVIDGTHYNDYVTGYYGGNMGNFTKIAAGKSVEVSVVADEITAETLKDCALLVISAPARKNGTANAGDYTASVFEDSFIGLVADYVKSGGSVVVCGLADYQDKSAVYGDEGHASAQLNKLLKAIGSTMRINDDEVYDPVSNGGQFYRLYPSIFNMDSSWNTGIVDGQVYSQYSGCSVNAGEGTWLVKGFDTTYSVDSDKDGVGNTDEIETDDSYGYNIVTPRGEVVFLACEDTAYGGTLFAAGGVFLSDFEVDADVDDYALPYANRTIVENILGAVTVELPLSTIAEVRAAGMGEVFRIRGYATAGRIEGNAFFDAMYLQDETGGITVFPIGEDGVITIGTPMEITGYVDAYQGDKEIQIMSYKILDEEPYIWEPELMSCKDAMDYEKNGGKLIQVQGTVKADSLEYNADGTLAQFIVVDKDGGEAKVFIDGYILSAKTGKNTLADVIAEGKEVSAVGLLYKHPEGSSDVSVPVLRVRNCDEVASSSSTPNVPDPDVPDSTDKPAPSGPDKPGDSNKPGGSKKHNSSGTSNSSAAAGSAPVQSDSAHTGDSSNMILWIAIIVCTAAAISITVVYKRKQQKK